MVKTKKKNVDDNPWPAEEISHTIIIPPNLHPSSSNGHDESEKDIQELCCESLMLKVMLKVLMAVNRCQHRIMKNSVKDITIDFFYRRPA
ncbi:unnamed protein product [Rhizophagus irregularis]|nr:unnamed protein product [Rhizophagus irregularis]